MELNQRNDCSVQRSDFHLDSLSRIEVGSDWYFHPLEGMVRYDDVHFRFTCREVGYYEESMVLVVPQEGEMSVYVKTVRSGVAVAEVVCGSFPDSLIRCGESCSLGESAEYFSFFLGETGR